MTFPMKNRIWDDLPLCPPAPPPLKSANFNFIVVSLSQIRLCDLDIISPLLYLYWKFRMLVSVFGRQMQRHLAMHHPLRSDVFLLVILPLHLSYTALITWKNHQW